MPHPHPAESPPLFPARWVLCLSLPDNCGYGFTRHGCPSFPGACLASLTLMPSEMLELSFWVAHLSCLLFAVAACTVPLLMGITRFRGKKLKEFLSENYHIWLVLPPRNGVIQSYHIYPELQVQRIREGRSQCGVKWAEKATWWGRHLTLSLTYWND